MTLLVVIAVSRLSTGNWARAGEDHSANDAINSISPWSQIEQAASDTIECHLLCWGFFHADGLQL